MSEATSSDEHDELPLAAAIAQIAEAIHRSRSPLFIGIENLSTKAQRAAIRLARKCHASFDSSSDNTGRGNMFALQKRGRVTATLGEVKKRSNLVVFWFCDPAADHPDFFQQFIGTDCETVVIHNQPNETSQKASRFIQLPEEQLVPGIWTLRAVVDGLELPSNGPKVSPKLLELAQRLKTSQYGALIWGSEHTDAEFDLQADGLHALVRNLNQHTRFVGIPYRRDANGLSAENVSTWISGFPFAVNWNRKSPRQHWLEYSDSASSQSDEWDLLMAFDIGEFTVVAQRMDGHGAFQITLPVAEFGISESGEACRFDDVGITVPGDTETQCPMTNEIIGLIEQAI